MLKESASLLEDAVRRINGLGNVDFVVFTGDMVNIPSQASLRRFIGIANTLKPRWYWTAGNHDVGGAFSKGMLVQMLNTGNSADRYARATDAYYSFKVKNFVFLCMDGAIEDKSTANGFFSPEQLRWLEAQLKANEDSYVVIFQHYPVVEPFHSESHYVKNAQQYLNIIDRYDNIVAVMSGHYHATKVKMRNNVAHISTPALVQYPNAFRIITLKTAGDDVVLSYEFFPTGLTEVMAKSASQSGSQGLHAGSETDRSGTITLHKPL
jgi:Icc protein